VYKCAVLKTCACITSAVLSGAPVLASDPLAFLSDVDFNDYAVGVAAAVTQQPYRGAGNSRLLYPFLTSVEDSTLTENAFVARNGTYGFRHVTSSGIEMGVLGHLEVLGFGDDPDPPLDELKPPQWTVEVGPSIGWRRGPIQPDVALRKGVWGGHDGWVGQFSLSAPVELAQGFVVPYVAINFLGSEYLEHYFGVRPRADRSTELPAYEVPDKARNYTLGLRASYRISDLWVLTGSTSLVLLDDAITASPLVDRDMLGSVTLGLAYNRSIFVAQNPDWRGALKQRRLSLALYGMAGTTRSDLVLSDAAAGALSDDLDKRLRDVLPLDSSPDFLRADAIWRIREKHRLELSYSNIERSRTVDSAVPDAPVGVDSDERLRLGESSRFVRAAYGYSLVNTSQTELGLLLGLHWPRLTASISSEGGNTLLETDASAPMFAVGTYGRLAMRHGFEAEVRVEAGGMNVGQYDGAVFDARGALLWKPLDWLALIAGYGWQRTRLEGYTDGFRGRFDQRTHGPLLGLRLSY